MKIIEALKKIKDLQRKASDIEGKISDHCADLDCENPIYADQRRQVSEWLQSHHDIIKEILHLRTSIARTNLATKVTIELGGKYVEKSIAEWIHRRKDLAQLEEKCWRKLTERNFQPEYKNKLTNNSPETIVKRRLYYDPKERDDKVELYRSEPSKINATLEIVNATTDLIEK
jgi:hypothetical protein